MNISKIPMDESRNNDDECESPSKKLQMAL